MKKELCASIPIYLILQAFLITVAVYATRVSTDVAPFAKQAASQIDVTLEYANGSIPLYSNGQIICELWYDWVNVNGTKVVFLAYFSKVVNSPIITFLGQHYIADNETEVFMANTLMLMEAYNDTNGNGIPDTVGAVNELQYNFLMNSSVGFTITPIEKRLVGDIAHYTWGVKYETIDGFFEGISTSISARAMISHVGFSYDYYIIANVSYLKTSFDIGKITKLEPPWPNPNIDITLDSLSLSLFFGTSTLSTKPYTVIVNGQSYNSTLVLEPAIPNTQTEVRVENRKAFEFIFGQNYSLYRDSNPETHQSQSAAVSTDSVPSSPRVSLTWVFGNLQGILHDLFPKISALPPEINLDYEASTLLYRVCYPAWEGNSIVHDPTYVAYLYGSGELLPPVGPPSPPPAGPSVGPPIEFLVAVAVVGTIVLAASLFELRRTRRILRVPLPLET